LDGTTHVVHDPLDVISKLVALMPRPHKKLVLCHGVLAPRSKLRSRVVSYMQETEDANEPSGRLVQPVHQRRMWAELMRCAFGYELLVCPRCGGKMAFLSCVLRRDVIAKILAARAGPEE
jgi:hypothetical protein